MLNLFFQTCELRSQQTLLLLNYDFYKFLKITSWELNCRLFTSEKYAVWNKNFLKRQKLSNTTTGIKWDMTSRGSLFFHLLTLTRQQMMTTKALLLETEQFCFFLFLNIFSLHSSRNIFSSVYIYFLPLTRLVRMKNVT